MALLEVAMAAIICWRLAVLVVLDDGPLGVFRRLREWAWRDGRPRFMVGDVLQCVGCAAFWLAVPAWFLVAQPADWLAIALAAWATATYLQKVSQ
jgi:hypothetical protein